MIRNVTQKVVVEEINRCTVIIAHLAGRRMVSGNPASPRLFPVTELLKRPSATDDGRNITFDYCIYSSYLNFLNLTFSCQWFKLVVLLTVVAL